MMGPFQYLHPPLFLFFSEASVNLAGEFCKNLPDAALDDFLADCGIIFDCDYSTDCGWYGQEFGFGCVVAESDSFSTPDTGCR